ncbi:ankyrin repeat-containing domain protein, partial [Baffinella frigidus]
MLPNFTPEMYRISHRSNAELNSDPVFAWLKSYMLEAVVLEDPTRALWLLEDEWISTLISELDKARRVEFYTLFLDYAVYRDNFIIAERILTEPKYAVDASCCDIAPPWCIDRTPLLHTYIGKALRDGEGWDGRVRMKILPLLLAHGANVNCLNFNGETPLHLIATDPGMEFWAACLINAGARCETATPAGRTPLHYACTGARVTQKQNGDIVRLLCDNGATPQATDIHGYTPLHLAALYGFWASIETLIKFAGPGFNLLCVTDEGDTAEKIASRIGLGPEDDQTYFSKYTDHISDHMQTAKMLEALRRLLVKIKHAKMGAVMRGSKGVHHPSVIDNLPDDVRRLVMSSGHSIHVMDPSVITDPASETIVAHTKYTRGAGETTTARDCVYLQGGETPKTGDRNPVVSFRSFRFWPPCITPVSHGNRKVLVTLYYTRLTRKSQGFGHPVLRPSHTEIAKFTRTKFKSADKGALLKGPATMQTRGVDLRRVRELSSASITGSLATVARVVRTGVVVDIRCSWYDPAGHEDEGCPPGISSEHYPFTSGTSMLWAALGGHMAVVEELLHHGADVNAADSKKRTALHYAAMFGNEPLLEFLLDNKADASVINNEGQTALHYASQPIHHHHVKGTAPARRPH